MMKHKVFRSADGKNEIVSFYNQILKSSIVPFEEVFVKTTFGETYLLLFGKEHKEKIVLLHGTGSNSAMWLEDVRWLAEKYCVYAVDIIGECGKSAENRPDLKSDHYEIWLNEIYEALLIKKASVIACSFGGWIALRFSLNYAEKVDQLILIASAGIVPVKLYSSILIMITSVFGTWGFNKISRMVYSGVEIDQKALQFAGLIRQYFVPRTELIPKMTDSELSQIRTRVYYLGGEHDCFYNSKSASERLSKNLRQVRCEVLENTGHVVINQVAKIIEFIESEK